MPLCTPALLVVIIWTFLNSWNEFIMALVFLSKSSSQTLTVIPTRFKNTFMLDLPKMYASLTIIITPVVVLYLLLQRYFQEGLTAGALKG
jgi:raffinose/stachyose/melibiose transport system permease protein